MNDKKLIDFCFWFSAACVLLLIATSCSPLAVYSTMEQTATPAATVTTISQADKKSPTPRPSCTVSTGVPAGSLNIRTGPGTEYPVITTLTEGDVLAVIDTRDNWLRVKPIGMIAGWINSTYCEQE